jgi:uncharacterized membrane protein
MTPRYAERERHEQDARARIPADSQRHASSGVGWSLAFAAGAAALLVLGTQARNEPRRKAARDGRSAQEWGDTPEVERSLTIERPSDDLYRVWRDPQTLPRVFGFFAEIRCNAADSAQWSLEGPFGRGYIWDMRLEEDRPGELLRWASPSSGDVAIIQSLTVRFRPASADRGTIVSLNAHFDPPGGMLGEAARKLFGGVVPGALASKALHLFKSLALTGEIPTTDRQPAARADTR